MPHTATRRSCGACDKCCNRFFHVVFDIGSSCFLSRQPYAWAETTALVIAQNPRALIVEPSEAAGPPAQEPRAPAEAEEAQTRAEAEARRRAEEEEARIKAKKEAEAEEARKKAEEEARLAAEAEAARRKLEEASRTKTCGDSD